MATGVLIIHGDSQFGFLDGVAREVACGFQAMGRHPVVMHLRDEALEKAASLIRTHGIELVLMMNGIGLSPESHTFQGFLNTLGVPAVAFFVDHPLYHGRRISAAVTRLIVTTTCGHDGDFIRTFIRDDVPVEHVHHGATPVPPEVVRPWKERDIAVLVPSTLSVIPEVERADWPARFGALGAAQLNAMVEAHDEAPGRPLSEAMQRVLGDRPVSWQELRAYYHVVDSHLRARIKLESVRALLDRGVRVTVLSAGWPDLGDRATHLPAVAIAEGYALMGRSKIVLNHLPPYFQSHERPPQAAVCGAVGASTPSDWVEKALDGHALMLPLPVREAAETIATALTDPALPDRAAVGGAAVMDRQLWRNRAAEFAAIAGLPTPAR